MEEATLDVLTLMQAKGLGAHRIAGVIRTRGVPEVCEHPRRFKDLLGEEALLGLESGSARREAEGIYRQALQKRQVLVRLGSEDYPASLSAIYDPPPVLFLRGSLRVGVRRVAIVGARAATPAGRSLARDLGRGLAENGIEVVSGLARGIDGAGHEGALTGGGTTVAVLGSGVDVVYPPEHESLAERVVSSGALISELPPGTHPAPAQFPSRNRIIVGLAEAVIVVEAGNKSGALITARLALDEGRDVLAVPGRPLDPLAHGPNLMIRDGATLVRGVDDVLEHLGIEVKPSAKNAEAFDPILRKLAESAPQSVDQLTVSTGLMAPALMARLSELELLGRVERLPGTLFRSAGRG